jgi:NADPH2:quinone reductase
MNTMKTVLFYEFGGPEVLKVEDAPIPEPAAGEALIKHEYIGVNFAETLMRRGLYSRGSMMKLPSAVGLEASGTVVKLGEGAEAAGVKLGGRVSALYRKGAAYAEYGVLPAKDLIPLPDDVPMEIGAAFPVQGLTAWHMLAESHKTQPGETVLIHAVAGGVGLLAVQIAKHFGARVIGTTSSEEKAKIARAMGADDIIIYTQGDWMREARKLSPGGVNLILDSVGRETFDKGLEALADFGQLILYGSASGDVPQAIPQLLMRGSRSITGFWLNTVRDHPEIVRRDADAVLGLYRDGKLKFTIDEVFPLGRAADAQRKLESRASIGKILLKP